MERYSRNLNHGFIRLRYNERLSPGCLVHKFRELGFGFVNVHRLHVQSIKLSSLGPVYAATSATSQSRWWLWRTRSGITLAVELALLGASALRLLVRIDVAVEALRTYRKPEKSPKTACTKAGSPSSRQILFHVRFRFLTIPIAVSCRLRSLIAFDPSTRNA